MAIFNIILLTFRVRHGLGLLENESILEGDLADLGFVKKLDIRPQTDRIDRGERRLAFLAVVVVATATVLRRVVSLLDAGLVAGHHAQVLVVPGRQLC